MSNNTKADQIAEEVTSFDIGFKKQFLDWQNRARITKTATTCVMVFFCEATLVWLGDGVEGKTKRENSEKSAKLPYHYLETIFAVRFATWH